MKKALLVGMAVLMMTASSSWVQAQQQMPMRGSGSQSMGPGMMYGQGYMMGGRGMMYGQGYMMGQGMYGPGMMGPSAEGWQHMTPEQRGKWQQMNSQFMQDTLALRQQLMSKQMELQTLWAQPKPDKAKVDKLSKEVTDLRAKLVQQHSNFLMNCRQEFGDRGWACPVLGN